MQIESEQNSKQKRRFRVESSFSIVFACVLFLSNSTASIGKTAEEYAYERAHALVKVGHSDQACEILLRISRNHPQDTKLLVELGETYLHDDNEMLSGHMKAEQYFRKAIKLDPELGKAYCLLAEWANAQCKYDLAIQMATKALTVKKPDMQAYLQRAISYTNLHKDKEAVADLDKFISQGKPQGKTLRSAYERRATNLENLQLYERALADYRYLQKEHYYEPTALKEANCLEKMNKNDEAVTCLNGLLKINPEDEAALEIRGRIWAKQGRYKEAIADYNKSIQLIPSAALFKQRADVYEKMGRKDLAARDRKEAERF